MNMTVWTSQRTKQILRLGWDTMSSTSSGLLCKMVAASLNVTPSRLVLFKEIRRPPGKIKKSLQSPYYRLSCSPILFLSIAMLHCILSFKPVSMSPVPIVGASYRVWFVHLCQQARQARWKQWRSQGQVYLYCPHPQSQSLKQDQRESEEKNLKNNLFYIELKLP